MGLYHEGFSQPRTMMVCVEVGDKKMPDRRSKMPGISVSQIRRRSEIKDARSEIAQPLSRDCYSNTYRGGQLLLGT